MNQSLGYSEEVSRECLKMYYVKGMGFRGIQRVKNVHHTTVICWVKQVGQNLPDAYAQLDNMEKVRCSSQDESRMGSIQFKE